MTINVAVVAQEFFRGRAGLLDPRGMWMMATNITGDATGGHIELNVDAANPFDVAGSPEHRLRYLYFVDYCEVVATTDPGNVGVRIRNFGDKANQAIEGPNYSSSIRAFDFDTQFWAGVDCRQLRHFPQFWNDQEAVDAAQSDICVIRIQTNTNATVYTTRVGGRFYDRRVLDSAAFQRLLESVPS